MSETEEVQLNNTNDTTPFIGGVIYTDGSCRNNNGKPGAGKIGWACHGFTYTTEPSKKGHGLLTHLITEQGYVPRTSESKEKYTQVTPIKYLDFFGSSDVLASNNTAEVEALVNGLMELQKHDVKIIHIFTDSEYLRRGLTEWSPIWKAKNWIKTDGQPVPNKDTWIRLLDEVDKLKAKDVKLKIDWVKGHNEVFGNVIADLLATVAVNYSMNQIVRSEFKTTDAQGYWKKDIQKHPFLSYKNMLFNSVEEYSTPGKYYLARYEGDQGPGKKSPESCYSIIMLKQPDSVLEIIRKKQFKVSNDINSVICTRLDKVFNHTVYPYIVEHGEYSLLPNRNNLDLNFLDDKPLSIELNPPGKALKAVEDIAYIEEMLNHFLYINSVEKVTDSIREATIFNIGYRVLDITDTFYEITTKEKKKVITEQLVVKKEFQTNDTKDLIVNVMTKSGETFDIKVPLLLGIDMLSRNGLKAIENLNPKVYLLTWKESDKCFKYAIVIQTNDAVGIWSNIFANNVLVV